MCLNVATAIKERQTAYLKGRMINDNIRSMLATINVTNLEERAKGILVSLDARKAFDSVEHGYIERCLKEFGCEDFIPIFRILYSELKTDILINGKIVDGFKVLRGVKQGDALSCIIFIMCMEPLLLNIECNPGIKPIETESLGDLPKAYAYADDVNCTIEDSLDSVQLVFNEYEKLPLRSGLILNADKTELLLVGSDLEKVYNIKYLGADYRISTKPKIKINGINFQRSSADLVDDNVNVVASRMDKFFKTWSRRNLSTLGRILIVKTFGLSQCIFLMQSVTLSTAHFKKINNLIFKFIWNRHYLASKAPERIKREIMYKPIKLGGYGMLNVVSLDESLKLKSIGRMLTSRHSFIARIRGKCDLSCFFEPKCNVNVEPLTVMGIELLKKEREKLWVNQAIGSNRPFLSAVRGLEISKILSRAGLISIPYFLARRRGASLIGNLTNADINWLRLYVDRTKINTLTQAINIRLNPYAGEINQHLLIGKSFKPISSSSSKEIRESRTSMEPLTNFKIGVNLSVPEALNWGFKLTKLTSTKHKNVLLRAAHGEIYTKERLHRFNLIDNNLCPRCDQIETLEHKLLECQYVKRIWDCAEAEQNKLYNLTNQIPSRKNRLLGSHTESTIASITLNSEILTRILYLRDSQNYLVHPRIFVRQAIRSIIAREKKAVVKNSIKTLLEEHQ